MKYRPEIDGLRATAILPVIVFHINSKWLSGGFLGVDVFFVISGYLITAIIAKEIKNNEFTFWKFIQRRIRRILPVLTIVVFVTLVAVMIIQFRGEHRDAGIQGLAALTSWSNFYFWNLAGNYWGPQASASPFLHVWSLGVEEQFYLLYPVMVYVLFRNFKNKMVFVLILGAILSLTLFIYANKYHPNAAFYLLPMRAWELSIGGILALILTSAKSLKLYNRTRIPYTIVFAVGFTAVLVSYIYGRNSDGFSAWAVLTVVGAVFIIYALSHEGVKLRELLTNRIMVYIGKISYSLYLWHWPVSVLSRGVEFNLPLWIQLLVILAISVISYHCIELPVRRLKINVIWIGIGVVITSLVAVFMIIRPPYYDIKNFNSPVWDGRYYDVTPHIPPLKNMYGVTVKQKDSNNINCNGTMVLQYGNTIPDIMLLGDSHALVWSGLLDAVAKELKCTISFNGKDGVSPFFRIPLRDTLVNGIPPREKRRSDSLILKNLAIWRPVVILAARWAIRERGETENLLDYIDSLKLPLLIIEQPPELYFGHKIALQYMIYKGYNADINSKQFMKINKEAFTKSIGFIEYLRREHPWYSLMRVNDVMLTADSTAWVLDGRNLLYIDDDHLSKFASLKFLNRVSTMIQNLLLQNKSGFGDGR